MAVFQNSRKSMKVLDSKQNIEILAR